MPAKAVRSPSHQSPRPQGRPSSDSALTALAACLARHGDEIAALRAERELLPAEDTQAVEWCRYRTAEAADQWWSAVDKIAALPAQGWTGMRVKSGTIHAVALEREIQDLMDDMSAADTLCRLAISLAHDVGRWSRRRA
jgi:hypothetical protein